MPPLQNVPSIDPLFCWSAANTTLSILHHVPIEKPECGFTGDDNIYGLGIRLAFYLQWILAILLTVFITGETHSTRQNFNTSLTFTFATFVTLIYFINTHDPSNRHATEVFVIYSLCVCGSISGDTLIFLYLFLESVRNKGLKYLLPRIFFKPKDRSAPQYGKIVAMYKFALDTAIASFSLWYWYTGIDNMALSSCSRSAFFFKKVDLYHGFRTFGKIFSTIWVLWICFRFVANIIFITREKGSRKPNAESKDESLVSSDKNVRLFIGIATLPIVALFILAVELPIRWNHIEGVNTVASTGQLIPLVVVLVSLISAIKKIWKNQSRKSKQQSEPPQGDVGKEKTQPVTDSTFNEELRLRPLDYHSGTSSSATPISPNIT